MSPRCSAVTSGFTDEGHLLLAEWPDGPQLFEHFRDLPGALWLPDAPAYPLDRTDDYARKSVNHSQEE